MILHNRGFAAAADGEVTDPSVWSEPTFDDDLRISYSRSVERVVRAFGADGVMERDFWLPRVDPTKLFPARQAISFHVLDYLVHGWDVAAALGRPVSFEPELVSAVQDIADREVPDGPRRRRPDASFLPPLPAPADATGLPLLLAALGRSPSWPD